MKQFQYMLGPYSIKQLCYIESINEMLNKSLDFFLFVIYNKALIISKKSTYSLRNITITQATKVEEKSTLQFLYQLINDLKHVECKQSNNDWLNEFWKGMYKISVKYQLQTFWKCNQQKTQTQ